MYIIQYEGMKGCVDCGASSTPAGFPTFVAGLNRGAQSKKDGGIAGLIFMNCQYTFTDIQDVTEWTDGLGAGVLEDGTAVIRYNCGLSASLASEGTEEEVGSCQTQIITKREHTIEFTDRFDNNEQDVFSLYEKIQQNPYSYKVAYITCDGMISPFNKASINTNYNIDETKDGYRNWSGSITWESLVADKTFDPTAATTPFTIQELLDAMP